MAAPILQSSDFIIENLKGHIVPQTATTPAGAYHLSSCACFTPQEREPGTLAATHLWLRSQDACSASRPSYTPRDYTPHRPDPPVPLGDSSRFLTAFWCWCSPQWQFDTAAPWLASWQLLPFSALSGFRSYRLDCAGMCVRSQPSSVSHSLLFSEKSCRSSQLWSGGNRKLHLSTIYHGSIAALMFWLQNTILRMISLLAFKISDSRLSPNKQGIFFWYIDYIYEMNVFYK